jgi:hypothetical protein
MTNRFAVSVSSLGPPRTLVVVLILFGVVCLSARPSWTQTYFHVVVEADSPPLSPPICPYCEPPHFCVPSRFASDAPQPILDSPVEAFGACSDAVGYFAALDQGMIAYDGQTEPPFEITIAVGTDATYVPTCCGPVADCDAVTLGIPAPVVSPCRLLSVRITDASSLWSYEDATGNLQFTLTGDPPTARLPEPQLGVSLGATLIPLVFAARSRRRFAFQARRITNA